VIDGKRVVRMRLKGDLEFLDRRVVVSVVKVLEASLGMRFVEVKVSDLLRKKINLVRRLLFGCTQGDRKRKNKADEARENGP
jgi:hypothetical protein